MTELLGLVGVLLGLAAIIALAVIGTARALKPWADRVEAKNRSRWG